MTVLVRLGIGSLRRPVSRGVPEGRGARGTKGSRGGGTEASSAVAGSGAGATDEEELGVVGLSAGTTDGEDSAGVVGGLRGHTRSGGSGAAKILCLRATAIGKVVSSKETLGATRMACDRRSITT